MFKFDFSNNEEARDDKNEENKNLTWLPATEIEITDEQFSKKLSERDYITITFENVELKMIKSESAILNLKAKKHDKIIKAESQHSDLIPAIYEGGLKIWECSYDLGKYFYSQNIFCKNSKVLDLGCGTGIIGILALLKGCTVHFQDYNSEVIELVTIPNVLLNLEDRQKIEKNTQFYAGDWERFVELLIKKYPNETEKYDVISTCETIYNSYNYQKLYQVFKQQLKKDGVGYIAGKVHYFGIGGNMKEFEKLIKTDNVFNVETVWRSEEGLQREILKLTHRH
ncbi:histidine protein methyltransferase 1 homolog isoform X2 [Chelonus insularis]|uniref:histidine protein methyltransferase 1 homolog isoform X2 n=1 Tax=Chelonus insularis TaxID=460826 RepID=UPI00158ECAAE|nr:histidine protein methyltransferase 1 homolog isoform X2 [Chelonus insularis]